MMAPAENASQNRRLTFLIIVVTTGYVVGMENIPIRQKDLTQRKSVKVCRDGRRRNVLRALTHEEWVQRFFEQIDKNGPNGCWLWTGAKYRGGYGHMGMNGKNTKVHRFSYEHFVGPIPAGLIVRHKCDNPCCVNPEHLMTGTHKDNTNDKIARGRFRYGTARGEANGRTKLTVESVMKTKEMWDTKQFTIPMIAAATGITRTNVGAIVQGRTWRHVTGYASPLVKV